MLGPVEDEEDAFEDELSLLDLLSLVVEDDFEESDDEEDFEELLLPPELEPRESLT